MQHLMYFRMPRPFREEDDLVVYRDARESYKVTYTLKLLGVKMTTDFPDTLAVEPPEFRHINKDKFVQVPGVHVAVVDASNTGLCVGDFMEAVMGCEMQYTLALECK